ncbi:MAG TPA: hypothetical protein VNC50_15955 [Planctomycetia bacterium]|nr:hypothetical protein [Planctomycetia bacterium]
MAPDDDQTFLFLHHDGAPPARPKLAKKVEVYAKVFGLREF